MSARLGRETLPALAFYTIHSGKGGNQAVGAARLGGGVSVIGKVGGDTFGATLLRALKAERKRATIAV